MSGDGDSRVVVLHYCLCWLQAPPGTRLLKVALRASDAKAPRDSTNSEDAETMAIPASTVRRF